ncbi:MAG: Uma2 family endonuclease [Bacteroidota bacterium]
MPTTTTVPLSPPVEPRLTYADLCAMPEDGNRYELIHGALVMSPSPSFRHQHRTGTIYASLLIYAREQDLGTAVIAPMDVVLDEDAAVVQPDVLFIARDRAGIIAEVIRGVPSLVVEVISPGSRRRDVRTKRALYAQYVVPEYWLVDPEADTVEIYRLPEGATTYERSAALSTDADDVLTTPLLPGWSLGLRALFSA